MGEKSRTHFGSLDKNYIIKLMCGECAKKEVPSPIGTLKAYSYATCPICKRKGWLTKKTCQA